MKILVRIVLSSCRVWDETMTPIYQISVLPKWTRTTFTLRIYNVSVWLDRSEDTYTVGLLIVLRPRFGRVSQVSLFPFHFCQNFPKIVSFSLKENENNEHIDWETLILRELSKQIYTAVASTCSNFTRFLLKRERSNTKKIPHEFCGRNVLNLWLI